MRATIELKVEMGWEWGMVWELFGFGGGGAELEGQPRAKVLAGG